MTQFLAKSAPHCQMPDGGLPVFCAAHDARSSFSYTPLAC